MLNTRSTVLRRQASLPDELERFAFGWNGAVSPAGASESSATSGAWPRWSPRCASATVGAPAIADCLRRVPATWQLHEPGLASRHADAQMSISASAAIAPLAARLPQGSVDWPHRTRVRCPRAPFRPFEPLFPSTSAVSANKRLSCTV